MKKRDSSPKAARIATASLSVLLAVAIGTTCGATSYRSLICSTIGGTMYKTIDKANAEPLQASTDNGMSLDEWKKAADQLVEDVTSEGIVLLKNQNQTLPLAKGSKVTLFGRSSVDLVLGGTGAGNINTDYVVDLKSAMEDDGRFTINSTIWDFYKTYDGKDGYVRSNGGYMGAKPEDIYTAEVPVSEYTDKVKQSYIDYNDAAIVVFSRVGGEASDMPTGAFGDGEQYLALQPAEEALLKEIKNSGAFDKIIAVINTSNAMELSWVDQEEYGIDACLWIGGVGQSGSRAVAKVLDGEVNPSGRLSDTYAADSFSSPAMQNFGDFTFTNANEINSSIGEANNGTKYVVYREGIYVGYRYYETRYSDGVTDPAGTNALSSAGAFVGDTWNYDNEVCYPFGYGLSYTTFEQTLDSVTIADDKKTATVTVTVKNTGDVAGKEVVQVYANPPYTKGGIEKASANLVGFAKTDLLQPGQSQTVTVDWVAQDMASYDWNDANANGYTGYELEAGNYVITARSNSHDVKLSETYTVAAGMNCTTDYITGNEIESLFVDDFTSVNDSLLSGMISRATGLTQPAPASKTDREISDDTLATLDGQYSYRSYMDQGYEEWFVNEDGIPSTWTQAATRTEGEKAPISIMDMAGIDFSLKIEDGEVVQGDDEGSQKWEAFMNQLTWEEMASLVNNGGGVKAIDAVDVVGAGVNETPLQLSGGTLWACPPILAATFNLDLAEEVGVMMGNEALFKGCSYWQGNAMNIHRSPLSGRNVEYYSQDGVHGGKFAAAVVAGVTSKGVTCHIKHMVLNDQESYRDLNGGVSTWATEQVIREIYAKPFEYALKVGRSTGVMSSFNRIGLVNSQLNLAMHKLVRNEWSNRAIFETDAWQGTYCPLDLMVRQGDNQVLGAGTTLPDIGLEIGAWDADGNCVRVSDGAEGTFLSQTHYAAVRRSAQEILWNYANSSAVHNGYIGFEPCVLEFDSYAAQSLPISFGDVDIATITLADGAQLPEGFTMSDAGVVTSDGSLAEGEWTIDIKLNGIDGYITLGAQAVIRVVDALHVSTTSLKVGEAANVTVDAPSYAYESLVKVNPRFVSTVKHTDGTPVAQGEMQGFGGKTTALSAAVEFAPTHIAGLPVAVNIGCHVTRHVTVVA